LILPVRRQLSPALWSAAVAAAFFLCVSLFFLRSSWVGLFVMQKKEKKKAAVTAARQSRIRLGAIG
jgi:hypothetical protein